MTLHEDQLPTEADCLSIKKTTNLKMFFPTILKFKYLEYITNNKQINYKHEISNLLRTYFA